jgi:hypothetical protein
MKLFKRLFYVCLVMGLIGSAVAVYSVKYEATFHAEKISKFKRNIQREREQIAVLNAEIAYLSQPQTISVHARHFLDLKPLTVEQVGSVTDLKMRGGNGEDDIAKKLEAMGIMDPDAAPATTGSAAPSSIVPPKKPQPQPLQKVQIKPNAPKTGGAQ